MYASRTHPQPSSLILTSVASNIYFLPLTSKFQYSSDSQGFSDCVWAPDTGGANDHMSLQLGSCSLINGGDLNREFGQEK